MKSVQEAIENAKKAIPEKAVLDNCLKEVIYSVLKEKNTFNPYSMYKDFRGVENTIIGAYKDYMRNSPEFKARLINLDLPEIFTYLCQQQSDLETINDTFTFAKKSSKEHL